MTIRVFLVDDQELVRAGFAMVIEAQDDMCVTGQAADGAEAVDLVRDGRADIVLMDVRMPRMDGVEATKRIVGRSGAPRVIVLTTFDLDEYAFAALRNGASGFLLKDVPPRHLLEAIRTVHRGDAVIAPSTTRRLLDHVAWDLAMPGERDDTRERLTEREREVLVALAHGASNAEIAAELFLSEATVKTHVGRVLAKYGLRDRVQAVVLAYERGIVRPRR